MFVPHDVSARVNLAVVALGTPERLYDALAAVITHESGNDFTVTCVVNAAGPVVAPPSRPIPDGIRTEYLDANLGWAGGLHRARDLTDAELMVWVQEDMVPEPGWLDALVAAADVHPGVGAFGSVRVEDGQVLLHNAGRADPPDRVERWNATDRTDQELPADVATYDWVTGKGLLVRTSVFDEVSGPDPRLWPLYHVDKDFCTHLRCHGWDVALVPGAHLRHTGGQSAPSAFRRFLMDWRNPWFDARWATSVAALAGKPSDRIEHPCAEWRDLVGDAVDVAVGIEASRMLVPFARERARVERAASEAARAAAGLLEERRVRAVAAYERARNRERQKTKRLKRAEAAIAEMNVSRSSRLTGQFRAVFRRLR